MNSPFSHGIFSALFSADMFRIGSAQLCQISPRIILETLAGNLPGPGQYGQNCNGRAGSTPENGLGKLAPI